MQSADRSHLHVGVKSGVTCAPSLLSAWQTLRASNTSDGWLTAIMSATPSTAELHATGSGGWPACRAGLGDGDILYGACAFSARTEGGLPRWFFFSWCGPTASPLKRGKVPLQRGAIYAALEGVVADLSLVEREDLEDAAVTARLIKALGDTARL